MPAISGSCGSFPSAFDKDEGKSAEVRFTIRNVGDFQSRYPGISRPPAADKLVFTRDSLEIWN